jgi:hypothetical protein
MAAKTHDCFFSLTQSLFDIIFLKKKKRIINNTVNGGIFWKNQVKDYMKLIPGFSRKTPK